MLVGVCGRASGAMYSTVPTGEMASSCILLMVSPKSPTRTEPSAARKMFSSFTSLHSSHRHLLVKFVAQLQAQQVRKGAFRATGYDDLASSSLAREITMTPPSTIYA